MIINAWLEAEQQIYCLCKQYWVSIKSAPFDKYCINYIGGYNYRKRRLELPPINCMENYVIALHELGHVVDFENNPEHYETYWDNMFSRETNAWLIGLKHSIYDIDDIVASFIIHALNTYSHTESDLLKVAGAKSKVYNLIQLQRKIHC